MTLAKTLDCKEQLEKAIAEVDEIINRWPDWDVTTSLRHAFAPFKLYAKKEMREAVKIMESLHETWPENY